LALREDFLSAAIPDLITLLDRWQQHKPAQRAVVDYDIQHSRELHRLVERGALTTRELWEQVLGMAASLRATGIGPGEIVAVQLPNWHEFLVAHLALYAIGAVTSPISPIYRKRDLARQFALSEAVTLIVPARFGTVDFVGAALELKQEFRTLREIIVVGNDARPGTLAWNKLLQDGASPDHNAERTRIARGEHVRPTGELMLLNFTSGTTGEPKGVMHSTESIGSCMLPTIERLQLGGNTVVLVAPTLGHGGGFLNGLYLPLFAQASVAYMDAWNARTAIRIIAKERVTYAPVMPTYLYDLVNDAEIDSSDLTSWITGRVSGGAISRPLMTILQEKLPQLRLCPGWGMSENLWSTCGGPDDAFDKRTFTDGNCVGDCELEIRDPQSGERLPTGTVGEIVMRGSSLCLGYYKRPEIMQQSMTPDGWFRTGDLARLDPEGFLIVAGRTKDLILRGGENIPAVEIEQLLGEHPRVAAVAVVGVPDARLGEKVCAVIELKDPALSLSFDEMSAYLLDKKLTKHFVPEYLVLSPALPRTVSGKIRKQDARIEALGLLGLKAD